MPSVQVGVGVPVPPVLSLLGVSRVEREAEAASRRTSERLAAAGGQESGTTSGRAVPGGPGGPGYCRWGTTGGPARTRSQLVSEIGSAQRGHS